MFGAHATSRTQSVWPSSTSSSTHACVSSRKPQIFTRLSQPADAKRFTLGGAVGACPGSVAGWGTSSEPGWTAGAQETALQPMAWPSKTSAPQVPSSLEGEWVDEGWYWYWVTGGMENVEMCGKKRDGEVHVRRDERDC